MSFCGIAVSHKILQCNCVAFVRLSHQRLWSSNSLIILGLLLLIDFFGCLSTRLCEVLIQCVVQTHESCYPTQHC